MLTGQKTVINHRQKDQEDILFSLYYPNLGFSTRSEENKQFLRIPICFLVLKSAPIFSINLLKGFQGEVSHFENNELERN